LRELRIAGERVLYVEGDSDDSVFELFTVPLTRKSSLAPWRF
jgi:hypothetical protein